MSNSTPVVKILLKAFFAALFSTLALVACGGGSSIADESRPNPVAVSTITISASATPSLVAYNGTSVISWLASDESSSCSSSPAGISGKTGTFTTPPLSSTTTYTITCVGPDTSPKNKQVTISVGSTSIINVQAAYAAEPARGTIYYYCDCGTGAEGGCVAGNDSNAGTSASAPRRTIANAMSRLNSLTGTNTIALCKGGAFNATGRLNITNSGCTTGTTCTDLREYTPPTFSGIAKPIITSASGTALFYSDGNHGGVRVMNLSLIGDNNPSSHGNYAFFLYNGTHDVKAYNLDVNNFNIGFTSQRGTAESINNEFVGNNVNHIYRGGIFGGGSNTKINYNYITDTGSNTDFQHAIYMTNGNNTVTSYNIEVIGNDIHGQYGNTCLGSVISNHGAIDGFQVKNNTITIDSDKATMACYGIETSNNTSAAAPSFFRNAVFSGNTIINGGSVALFVTSCPNCIIENNLIINNWSNSVVGISITGLNRGQDDTSTANTIRNNTIWYGTNVTQADTRGVEVGRNGGEGTNHIISNNTVSSTQSSGTLNCYGYYLPLTSFAFINNNHCHATGSYNFEFTRGTLAAWRTYASGFDTASIEGDPKFTATGIDYFKPLNGSSPSPLIGAGASSAAYMSVTDFTGAARPAPPSIGAYEP